MASVSLVTSAGITSVATPRKERSTDLVTRAGLLSAPVPVSWAGSTSVLSKVPWLPPYHVKPVRPDGNWDPQVYKALRWLFEEAIGGINAPTLPQVRQDVVATQAQATATSNYATQVGSFAAGIGSSVSALTEVVQSNSLTGAESVPDVPDAPAAFEP